MQGYTTILCSLTSDGRLHQLFAKEYTSRAHTQEMPPLRTLLLLNVPPYATEDSFKQAFSVVGPIQAVSFYDDHKNLQAKSKKLGYKAGAVVFQRASDLDKALKLKSLGPISTPQHRILLGMRKWAEDYNNSVGKEQKLADYCLRVLSKYNKDDAKAAKEKEEVDDEGWTVVTAKGRNAGLARTESTRNKIVGLANKKGLTDFYSFQGRESKMKKIEELRRKMGEDLKQIEGMKKNRKEKKDNRKFRPY